MLRFALGCRMNKEFSVAVGYQILKRGHSTVTYDEFELFHENINEYSLNVSATPLVERIAVTTPDNRSVSALKWGDGDPEVVFVHGTGQNAHTWDTVLLDLGKPALAIDLPGHGHSCWRDDAQYSPSNLAADLALLIQQQAPRTKAIVGMSLGGITSLSLANTHPELVKHLVMVDITPGVTTKKAKVVLDFVQGPQSFENFGELLARTIAHHPTRSESSLRRGILHNAKQLNDGSWEWRYDRRGGHSAKKNVDVERALHEVSGESLWGMMAQLLCPLMLIRGGLSPVVEEEDVAELYRRKPDADVLTVNGAGHSIQGDKPVELAAILSNILKQ